MEPELEKLEAALSSLVPERVPEELEGRIFAALDSAPAVGAPKIVRFPALRRLGAAAAVAVAAIGVFFAILNSPRGARERNPEAFAGGGRPQPTFVPVRAENVFEGATAEGLTLTGDNRPVQRLRYRFSDTYHWRNPEDGSTIEMVVPRERVFLVPARTD